MLTNEKDIFCDPIKINNHEITNLITAFSFVIFGLIYYIKSKNKIKNIPFLIATIVFSISTFLCHSFLPNNYYWVEILALNLSHSVFIAYFICYILNNFKYYYWLCISISIFLTCTYYILFVNLFNIFKSDNYDKLKHSDKLLLSSGTYFTQPLLLIALFGFGYFILKNWNLIIKSKLYIISIIGLLICVGLILFIWTYSFPHVNINCNNKFPFHALFHLLCGFSLTLFYAIINHFN